MKRIAVGSAIALASAVLVAAPAQASPGQSGAIAYSPADGVYGWTNYAPTLETAKAAAVEKCVGGGGTDCRPAAWVTDGCVTLIVDSEGDWGGGFGKSIDAAIANAFSSASANSVALNRGTQPEEAFCTF